MSTLLIGSEGSMGKRYQAILNYLNLPFITSDIETCIPDLMEKAKRAKNVVIATPTETHIDYLLLMERFKIPVLCEKPLSKNRDDLHEIRFMVQRGMNLTMMFQYQMLEKKYSSGPSSYNYFRHGNDSLSWDCIQVIGLANSVIEIKEDSPIWKCMLNGQDLSLSDMDKAYVDFILNWYHNPGQDIEWLIRIHEKVQKYEEEHGVSNS